MEITVKDAETGVVYQTSPARDVAFFTPAIMEGLGFSLKEAALSADHKKLVEQAGGQKVVWGAFLALCRFMKKAIDPMIQTPQLCLEASGFMEYPREAIQVVMEKFAQALMGAFWSGIRSSTMNGEAPMLSRLLQRAEELSGYFNSLPATEGGGEPAPTDGNVSCAAAQLTAPKSSDDARVGFES